MQVAYLRSISHVRRHSIRFTSGLIACLLILGLHTACVSTLLTEEEVRDFNKEYATRVMTARTNIFATFSDPESPAREILFRQGTKLRIWVESEGDWIKVRAVEHNKPIENNPGRTIIYVIREVLEDSGASDEIVERYPRDKLEAEIRQLLQ